MSCCDNFGYQTVDDGMWLSMRIFLLFIFHLKNDLRKIDKKLFNEKILSLVKKI